MFIHRHRHSSSTKRRHFFTKVAYVTTVLTLFSLLAGTFSTHVVPHASADSTGYTQDQLDALDFLNTVRAKVGVPPLKLNPLITRAAESHATYYNTNKSKAPDLSSHLQVEGMPGFTGKNMKNRIEAAGYAAPMGYAYSEAMHFKQKSSSAALQGFLDTAYHREIVLDPTIVEAGFGLVDGTAVADFAGPWKTKEEGTMAVYPYDQQTNVPVGFYGNEIPNPLKQFGVTFSGYIISAAAQLEMISHQVIVKDSRGNELPYHEQLHGKTLFIYPKSVLKGNQTYTVSLTYSTGEATGSKNKTWSFTTGKGTNLTSITPFIEEVTLNQGEQLQLRWTSHYDDNAFDEATEGLSYISSNAKGLKVSTAGIINAIQPGNYTVKATLEGKTTQVQVKVYPKWKTRNYNSSLTKLPSDITGHPLQEALEWGLKLGIVSPASNGLLQPNSTVTEAEFWMMLLKAYRIDIQSYQAPKKTLVDAAYQIAKDRNYPLAGITKVASRNKAITRLQIAEIVSAADGKHFVGSNAIQYVLGNDYVRGKTELSYSGYEGSDTVTRAEALQILKYLHNGISVLEGRPTIPTDPLTLPKMPKKEVYIKPATYTDQSFFAEYRPDGRLVLEGKFLKLKGQSINIKVQEGPISKHIEEVTVQFDQSGNFHTEVGPYSPQQLNLYMYAPSITYGLTVIKGKMNMGQF
ncbi:Ig-like domain-containing protein [Paenibacillus amylolyticus]|uniref:Ig-like domain-containing protein n=1 Tax=Paenibacillus amylolyticus TaxID=1451 RepID=UPI00286A4531|nr:Ig-like domain-containing protein [Paenibacillus amylolyticus]